RRAPSTRTASTHPRRKSCAQILTAGPDGPGATHHHSLRPFRSRLEVVLPDGGGMFLRRHESVPESTELLVQAAGLVLFTAAAIVLVRELVTAAHPTPFELIRWAGGTAVFLFADVYLAVGLVSGRPLSGRSQRLDAQLALAWMT